MQGQMSHTNDPLAAGRFHTTHWSVVLRAGQGKLPESDEALEKLCRAYWQPICLFACRKGSSEEDAKDLTQQFFSRLLERNDFAGVDPQKGKFRTFLLASFTHFLANEYDRASALKRGGGKTIFSLDELSSEQLGEVAPAANDSPAHLFDRRWATAVLERAIKQLQIEMSAAGKSVQFDLLKKFLTADAFEGEYESIAQKLGVAGSSVAVLVHRLRQRYRELVRAEVAQTVSSPVELEEEMRHLFEVLNQQ
jgi:DNA-directed RNA polymerase specialized sigma24 family protein